MACLGSMANSLQKYARRAILFIKTGIRGGTRRDNTGKKHDHEAWPWVQRIMPNGQGVVGAAKGKSVAGTGEAANGEGDASNRWLFGIEGEVGIEVEDDDSWTGVGGASAGSVRRAQRHARRQMWQR